MPRSGQDRTGGVATTRPLHRSRRRRLRPRTRTTRREMASTTRMFRLSPGECTRVVGSPSHAQHAKRNAAKKRPGMRVTRGASPASRATLCGGVARRKAEAAGRLPRAHRFFPPSHVPMRSSDSTSCVYFAARTFGVLVTPGWGCSHGVDASGRRGVTRGESSVHRAVLLSVQLAHSLGRCKRSSKTTAPVMGL